MFSSVMPMSVSWMEDIGVSWDPPGIPGGYIVVGEKESLERLAVNKIWS